MTYRRDSVLYRNAAQPYFFSILLELFREVAKKKMCRFWNTPKELAGMVSRGLAKMRQDRPAVGWVRASLVPDESAANEIVRLRHEIDELKQRWEVYKSEPPKGAEIFAQGNEQLILNCSYEAPQQADFQLVPFATTWNEVYSVVAPLMITGATDLDLKHKVVELFTNRQFDKNKRKISRAYIRDEDFQRVKIQFRALGLIARDDSQIRGSDGKRCWILTPHGDTVMTRVAAVRSSHPPGF